MGYGDQLALFRTAIKRGDLLSALEAARGMREHSGKPLHLHDSLELVLLMARDNDPRFNRAAPRWIGKLADEGRSLIELQIAASALLGLTETTTRGRSELILRDLVSWIRPSQGDQAV